MPRFAPLLKCTALLHPRGKPETLETYLGTSGFQGKTFGFGIIFHVEISSVLRCLVWRHLPLSGLCLFLGHPGSLSEAALHVVWLTSNLRDSFVISSLFFHLSQSLCSHSYQLGKHCLPAEKLRLAWRGFIRPEAPKSMGQTHVHK